MADPCGNCGHSKESHDAEGCVMCISLHRTTSTAIGCPGYRPPGPQDQDPRDTQLAELGQALDQALKALDLRMPSKVRLHLERAITLHGAISK